MKNKRLLCLICLLLLIPCLILPVSANSAQQHWTGTDASGAIVTDGESPIVVEKELLTFDLSEFPSNHYYDNDAFLAYSGRVTAEYTFYNPSDMIVSASLAFPFGRLPSYSDNSEMNDVSKYTVTLNGEEVNTVVRHTLSYAYGDFDIDSELPLISEGYIETDFYKPDTTVTLYAWTVSGIGEEYRAANVAFDVSADETERIYYMVGQSGGHRQKDGDYRVSDWAENNDSVLIYVFGEAPAEIPKLTLYENGGVEDGEEIGGAVSFKGKEVMTFEDFALLNREEDSPVSEIDWYNAVITELCEGGRNGEFPVVSLSSYESGFARDLMRWYQYEITLEPGEKAVNTVVAPMYPDIDLTYVPAIHEYTYLVSPASTWADFGELKIILNTPYYLTKSSYEGFKKTDSGYEVTFDGLPTDSNGEVIDFVFTLSTEENPVHKSKTPEGIRTGILYAFVFYGVPIIIGLAAIAVIVLIVHIIRKIKKR